MKKQLPHGFRTLTDESMIQDLIKDETFINSMQETLGKIREIWVDWKNNQIVCEPLAGEPKAIDLKIILDFMKKHSYHKYMQN